ncbi:MAG TPA: phosphotransferase [Acidobacteriaceae bacterium]|nr:phosphotransferase [Acidobacteriaceae bacterium]
MDESEELLLGGNVSDRVVKVGLTVRKPFTRATPSVEAFLNHLHAHGFRGAPRSLGRDEQGRQVLEYISGVPCRADAPLSLRELTEIGAVIRELHEASADFCAEPNAHWNIVMAPDGEDLICHNDLAPWNLIRNDERWVFIDWDGAAPGTRLWDLSYAAVTFLPIEADGDPVSDVARLRAMVEGYGLNGAQCRRLPELMLRRTRAMQQLLMEGGRSGQQPWARLYAEGHAIYWGAAAEYIERNLSGFAQSLLE